ncbi:MAG: S9 family peptidase [Bulleidia sp.]|nr:S9 family peptidase [Bulleidia sp.]
MTKKKDKELLQIEDLTKYTAIENLQYSPNGTCLAFQTGIADTKKNNYHRDVWLVKDGTAKQFTSTLNTTVVLWDDDSHLIVNRTKEDDEPGTTNLYRIGVDGGEASPFMKLTFPLVGLKKVSKGCYAAVGVIDANDADAYKDDEKTRKEKLEAKKKDADYQVIDEVPYWFNGQGFINKNRTALFLVELKPELTVKRLTAPSVKVGAVCVAEDKVYYTTSTVDPRTSRFDKISVFDTKTKKTSSVYGKMKYSINELFFMNEKLYCIASDMKEYGVNETGNICEVGKDELTMIVDPLRQLHDGVAGDTYLGGGKSKVVNDGKLVTLATNYDHVEIWKYDADFNKTVLFDEQGTVFCVDSVNDKIAYVRSTEDTLQEVYEMDLNGENIKQITHVNEEVLRDKYIAKPNVINYTSEGLDLKGWVLLPKDFDKKKKYPAILDVHGGPRGIYSNMFFHEMQVWAAAGYVVFFTNIKGSDGRDDEFADIRNDYGGTDFKNLMDFTDAVLEKYPNIDTKRLCETGGSYGGFMTNWIIGHTDRFCCAASQRSISNWISFSFISDIGLYFGPDQNGCKGLFSEEDVEKMWNHSPLKYADNVKTPTLFIHSDEDYRCPLPEGMQMMQALAYKGVETRMCIFHGENHELSRSGKLAHRIRRLTEITNWFNEHTK